MKRICACRGNQKNLKLLTGRFSEMYAYLIKEGKVKSIIPLIILLILTVPIISSCKRTKEEHIAKAKKYLEEKNYNAAIIEFKNVIDVDPNDYELRLQLGEIYFDVNKFDNAEQEIRSVIEKNPDLSHAHFLLSSIYFARKEYEDALKEAKLSLKLNKGIAEDETLKSKRSKIHNLLGRIYMSMEEPYLAGSHFDNAIELDPNNINVLINQGTLCMQMRNYVDAKSKFEEAMNKSPKNVRPYLALGRYYIFLKGYDKNILWVSDDDENL